jgi:GT2 family glycosyltransferase
MNAVLSKAKGDFVVLMGNDVFPDDGWTNIIELAKKTGAWITCPINTQTNINSYNKINENDEYFETDMFPAVCWVLSRECIDKIGAFDEQFAIGCYEDNDYCKRVLMAGGKIVVSKNIMVKHLVSQTLSQFDIQKVMQSNYQKYVSKWS